MRLLRPFQRILKRSAMGIPTPRIDNLGINSR
jgi:hypothetical protein